MDIDENTIRQSASVTFFNVLFLSLIFTVINEIYRKISVERPVKRILKATEQITQGNFNVRIKPIQEKNSVNQFDEIIGAFNKIAAEKYNLGEQLCECLLLFEEAWEKKNLEIETDIDEEFIINADKDLLSLVWNNLISNAVKFTPNGGTISLSLKNDDNYAVVQVSDTGCGMSAEVGAHIFEKFYQGDTSHAEQGNGLGLALVKRVIDIVNGEISVESIIGKGTVFCVKLKL